MRCTSCGCINDGRRPTGVLGSMRWWRCRWCGMWFCKLRRGKQASQDESTGRHEAVRLAEALGE